jgi:hypothetical protein
MFIPFEEVRTLLEEQDVKPARVVGNKESRSQGNKIVRPQGVIIQDTWNNFVFPIRPIPRIDTSKFDTIEIIKQFRTKYSSFPSLYLPWHFLVEIIGSRYYILQMRPIDTKFPMDNQQVLKSKHYFDNEQITNFFEQPIRDVNEMLHVCIIGDSNTDVYSEKVYRQIGRTCLSPFFRNMFITGSYEKSLFNFNMGKKFKFNSLIRFARR